VTKAAANEQRPAAFVTEDLIKLALKGQP
jgi:hypothetical protein